LSYHFVWFTQDIEYNPTNLNIVIANEDKLVLFDPESGDHIKTILSPYKGNWVENISFQPTSSRIYLVGRGKTVWWYNNSNGKKKTFEIPFETSNSNDNSNAFLTSDFDYSGKFFIIGGDGPNHLLVLKSEQGDYKKYRKFSLDTRIWDAEFYPESSKYIFLTDENSLKILNIIDKQVILEINHPEKVYDVEISTHGEFVATSCRDGNVRIWKVKND